MRRFIISATTFAALQMGCGKGKPSETATPADPTRAAADVAVVVEPEAPVTAVPTKHQPEMLPKTATGMQALGLALDAGTAGCLAMTRDGEEALVTFVRPVEGGMMRRTVWLRAADPIASEIVVDVLCGRKGEDTCVDGRPPPTEAEKARVLAATAQVEARLVPCHAANPGAAGKGMTLSSRGRKVELTLDDEALTFVVEAGNQGSIAAFNKYAPDEDRRVFAYGSDDAASVFVAVLTPQDFQRYVYDEDFYLVRGSELGTAPCWVHDSSTLDVSNPDLPPVPTRFDKTGCVAMSGDGKAVLLSFPRMFGTKQDWGTEGAPGATDEEAGRPFLALTWVGADLGLSLDCVLEFDGCTGSRALTAKTFIATHGLTGCPEPTRTLIARGATFPLRVERDRLWWVHPTLGPRWLATLSLPTDLKEPHKSFEGAWQHPSGGPLFVLHKNVDSILTTHFAELIPTSAFGLCEEAP